MAVTVFEALPLIVPESVIDTETETVTVGLREAEEVTVLELVRVWV